MTDELKRSRKVRAECNRRTHALRQLATGMENEPSNEPPGSIRSVDYKVRAGKVLFEAFQSGEFHGDGRLCQILDQWNQPPVSASADWQYLQAVEAVCWEWYGSRFGGLKQKMGELRAVAHVLRLLIGELERENID